MGLFSKETRPKAGALDSRIRELESRLQTVASEIEAQEQKLSVAYASGTNTGQILAKLSELEREAIALPGSIDMLRDELIEAQQEDADRWADEERQRISKAYKPIETEYQKVLAAVDAFNAKLRAATDLPDDGRVAPQISLQITMHPQKVSGYEIECHAAVEDKLERKYKSAINARNKPRPNPKRVEELGARVTRRNPGDIEAQRISAEIQKTSDPDERRNLQRRLREIQSKAFVH